MANQAECLKLMALIKANYPSYHARTDHETKKAAVGIMAIVLNDLDYQQCEAALLRYMSEPHEFPPNPGQIKCLAVKIAMEKRFLALEKQERLLLAEPQSMAMVTIQKVVELK